MEPRKVIDEFALRTYFSMTSWPVSYYRVSKGEWKPFGDYILPEGNLNEVIETYSFN